MSHELEAIEAEMAHQVHAVLRLGPLRGAGMVGRVDGLRGLTEAAKVGADYREAVGEDRGDAVPGGVGARMAVEKQKRRAAAANADPQRRLGQLDPL